MKLDTKKRVRSGHRTRTAENTRPLKTGGDDGHFEVDPQQSSEPAKAATITWLAKALRSADAVLSGPDESEAAFAALVSIADAHSSLVAYAPDEADRDALARGLARYLQLCWMRGASDEDRESKLRTAMAIFQKLRSGVADNALLVHDKNWTSDALEAISQEPELAQWLSVLELGRLRSRLHSLDGLLQHSGRMSMRQGRAVREVARGPHNREVVVGNQRILNDHPRLGTFRLLDPSNPLYVKDTPMAVRQLASADETDAAQRIERYLTDVDARIQRLRDGHARVRARKKIDAQIVVFETTNGERGIDPKNRNQEIGAELRRLRSDGFDENYILSVPEDTVQLVDAMVHAAKNEPARGRVLELISRTTPKLASDHVRGLLSSAASEIHERDGLQ